MRCSIHQSELSTSGQCQHCMNEECAGISEEQRGELFYRQYTGKSPEPSQLDRIESKLDQLLANSDRSVNKDQYLGLIGAGDPPNGGGHV